MHDQAAARSEDPLHVRSIRAEVDHNEVFSRDKEFLEDAKHDMTDHEKIELRILCSNAYGPDITQSAGGDL
ncbi:hypothetical protein FKW77_008441 [Venturia effusa]|uniref:Uncharacterized protein n=1 Tax=Venturia effusa TaxID=50376 RepID=A0A517LHX1_9PEZI|nr:hypothetical protein FKW77_008441 [Venturia effusa]